MCQTQNLNYIAHVNFAAQMNYSTCTVSRQRLNSMNNFQMDCSFIFFPL